MPRDPYDDDEPERRPKSSAPGGLGDNLGPLPVWGWAVVAIAAVFLWRRISGPSSAAAPTATLGTNYPQGPSLGGVFLIPNGSGGSPAPSPAPGVPGTPAPPAAVEWGPVYPRTEPTPPGGLPLKPCAAGLVPITGATSWSCAPPAVARSVYDFLASLPK